MREETPNDPKLSDGGACPTVERTADGPNVDADPLVESTRRDSRSGSLQRMGRRWIEISYHIPRLDNRMIPGTPWLAERQGRCAGHAAMRLDGAPGRATCLRARRCRA